MEYIGILIRLQKWVNLFSGYILWLMMVYLTDVWELKLIHAAAIINIWMGFIKILPIVFAYLADAFLGNSFVVLFSSFSSMIGLGLIWMSTPPVLGKSNGNCTQYKPECIGEQQKQLFYSGLVFTALGMAALSACYAPFAQEQAEEAAASNSTRRVGWCRTHLVAFAALLIAAFVKPWAILFGICAILGVVSFFFCLILRVCLGVGNPAPRPQGSPLTTIFRVLFAAVSKSFFSRPQDMNELYENPNSLQELLPHTNGLRCLDKAAIIEAEPVLEQQVKKRWSLCKVTEVEETKIFIRTIPIWMTFIVCGFVSSLGATYFLEQANHLDRRVGKAKTPLILFYWFYDHFRKSFTSGFLPTMSLSRRYIPRIGIAAAMMYATLACIAAAKIETRRLGVVKSHDLIDKPHERVPMTIFWLLFQFVLLGCHDGIHRLSAYGLSLDQAPKSMVKYFNLFARGFFGLGVMGSVVLVDIVGNISEKRTGINWFQSTLNTSRLDNYYWVLASLAAVNLVIFIVAACFYRYRVPRDGQLEKGLLPVGFMDDDHI
ncbi:protein NRT1/ PTR FAMILY 5.5-like [Chenopodium quinoa]|uniref:protein NRT1/ PTR FAMILY 5.5-like n=1 Tax=Chenopodium quinoa TaxID=63459 RepID=UPI000B770CD7|nr:protein NRT1/ PTR FAMILY 5.5-like [Chenopodium quinoa]